jgi:hypothetical protein
MGSDHAAAVRMNQSEHPGCGVPCSLCEAHDEGGYPFKPHPRRIWRNGKPAYAVMAVYVHDDKVVMCLGTDCQPIPEYQGNIDEVGERLAKEFPRERWQLGVVG